MSDTFGFQLPVMIIVRSAASGTQTRELRHIRQKSFDSGYFQPDASFEVKVVQQNVVEK